MKRFLIIFFIGLTFFAGCKFEKMNSENTGDKSVKGHSVDEISRVKDTIILYDTLLADGYRAQNMNALTQVATEQRAQKAYYHMAALGEGSVKMDSRLNDIVFKDLKIMPPDKAEALTVEKWDYEYINIRTGIPVYDNSVAYELGYHLIKISGKWLVDDITVVSEKEKKGQKYAPFAREPGK